MLQHYEKECAFHIIDCFRCGDAVRHRDLSSHYASGCPSGLSSEGAGYASLKSATAIVRGARASLEEMKAQLVNPDRDQLMPAIQSRMNELAQQMREHQSWLAEFTREVGASAGADMAQVAASISSKMAGQPRYPRSETAEEASTTSPRQLRLQKSKTCRWPYFFVNLPPDLLQGMRQTSSQDYPQHAVSKCGPRDVKCHLNLTTPLSTTRSWRDVQGSVKYVLTLTNGDMDLPITENICARLTVLHTRDAYFTFEVDMKYPYLHFWMGFHGSLAGRQCSMPPPRVKLFDGELGNSCYLTSVQERCRCMGDENQLLHFRRLYRLDSGILRKNDLGRGPKLELEIEVLRDEPARP
ncbi:hypothetical protein HPB52_025173 [Rhipicephalus sanguineus]|uniref:TRAF-type domain-containing protein n=1 Tax=Rhipicephalus sanguineus TaxID=34632 RepID=A0A9D4SMH3_RHISA|nr:hypothetical protein HPB52_024508 [Rhipicephalus sanguineus]KAH7986145.1 hypothetical protein HPB52_025173 [Rhipicephalus sanguineus]